MPTVLVTGAARGLGAEFVRQYARDGWHVLGCARGKDRIDTTTGRITAYDLDSANEASMQRLAHELGDSPIDVLIHCAGTMGEQTFAEAGLDAGTFGNANWEEWSGVFKLNVFGPMRLSELLVDNVAASTEKKIVTLTSILGSVAKNTVGGLYAYRASKSAVNAVMASMAIDLGKHYGITAIPLHPGWVQTDMGGGQADIDAITSVTGMRSVIDQLTPDMSGKVWMYDGSELPW